MNIQNIDEHNNRVTISNWINYNLHKSKPKVHNNTMSENVNIQFMPIAFMQNNHNRTIQFNSYNVYYVYHDCDDRNVHYLVLVTYIMRCENNLEK